MYTDFPPKEVRILGDRCSRKNTGAGVQHTVQLDAHRSISLVSICIHCQTLQWYSLPCNKFSEIGIQLLQGLLFLYFFSDPVLSHLFLVCHLHPLLSLPGVSSLYSFPVATIFSVLQKMTPGVFSISQRVSQNQQTPLTAVCCFLSHCLLSLLQSGFYSHT